MKKWKLYLAGIILLAIPAGFLITEVIREHLPVVVIDEATPNWGITLSAQNVTSTGLTIVCTQAGGEATGELQTGSYYTIHKLTEDGWVAVDYLPHDYDIAWTMEAWLIPMNDVVEWEVDWEWLYGELPAGSYRIGKSIDDFKSTGNYDTAMFYAEFDIN